jgi:hypothetical protein
LPRVMRSTVGNGRESTAGLSPLDPFSLYNTNPAPVGSVKREVPR